jgi:hypothetical protein
MALSWTVLSWLFYAIGHAIWTDVGLRGFGVIQELGGRLGKFGVPRFPERRYPIIDDRAAEACRDANPPVSGAFSVDNRAWRAAAIFLAEVISHISHYDSTVLSGAFSPDRGRVPAVLAATSIGE